MNNPRHIPVSVAMITMLVNVSAVLLRAQTSAPADQKAKSKIALITFYSNEISLTGGLPGQKSEGFRGRLFVDSDQLAFLTNGRFFTMEFLPGHYQLTATTWAAAGPAGGAHLDIDLAAGQHYFVEARTKVSFPFSKMFGIKQLSCADAQIAGIKSRPLDTKELKAAAAANLVAETSFPVCR